MVLLTYDSIGRLVEKVDTIHISVPTIGRRLTTLAYLDNDNPAEPSIVTTQRDSSTVDITRTSYNAQGLPDTLVAPSGHKTVITYGQHGKPNQVTELSVSTWTSAGLSTGSQVVTFQYDAGAYNTSAWTNQAGSTTTLRRDNSGRVTASINGAGDSVRTIYNAQGIQERIIRFDTAQGSIIRDTVVFVYNNEGELTQRWDQRGKGRTWYFDAMGRDTAMMDELGNKEYRRYTKGVLSTFVNRRGDSIRYSYNGAGKERTRISFNTQLASPNNQHVTTTAYNSRGWPETMIGPDGSVERSYYAEGNLYVEAQTHFNVSGPNVYEFGYTYNRSGARRSMTYPRPGTSPRLVTYTYGPGDLVSKMNYGAAGDTITFLYDELGRRSRVSWDMNKYATFAYDSVGKIGEVKHFSGSTADMQLSYVYDAAGRLQTLNDSAAFSSTTFEYDHRGRMRTRVAGGTGTTYEYDRGDNLIRDSTAALSTEYTIDAMVARVTRRDAFVNSSLVDTEDYSYDLTGSADTVAYATGNVAHPDLRRRALYDAENRLRSNTASSILYRYDPLNRMIRRAQLDVGNILPMVQNVATFYDGSNVIKHHSVEILHGPGTDDPLLAFYGTAPCNYVTVGGRQLSHRKLSDNSDCTTTTLYAYGGRFSGAIDNSYSFDLKSGTEGNLSYFRNRWYDSKTGRFTQEDPIGFAGGLNLYAYAGNNPATYTDPFGLCFQFTWCREVAARVAKDPAKIVTLTTQLLVGAVQETDRTKEMVNLMENSSALPQSSSREAVERLNKLRKLAGPGSKWIVRGGTGVAIASELLFPAKAEAQQIPAPLICAMPRNSAFEPIVPCQK